ncbi:MAG TPA: maleylacetate reductase [Bauldia sp.]|nr:maleylacetate reductase [Bauldia sp.]
MVTPFVFQGSPQRVVFGSGTIAQAGAEAQRLGIRRPLVLATPGHRAEAEALAARLGEGAAIFAGARMHTPIEVTEEALALARGHGSDGTVAIGGGSTIGLGKAIALRTDFPQIAIPTTYAGSEMTDLLGETDKGEKRTRRDPKIRPETVIYDVDLTLTLPTRLSANSGMNAIAHAVEGLYARDGNPILRLMAEEGIRALAAALPLIVRDPRDRDARSDALYGAWLCGTVLGGAEVALHHKLCHVLGGAFALPHAETHAVILPHAVAYNTEAVPDAMARAARALGGNNAAEALFDLALATGAATALRDIGMPEDGIERAADLTISNPYWNPRPLERDAILTLLRDAWHGRRPRSPAVPV